MTQLPYNSRLLAADALGLPWPNRGLTFGNYFLKTLVLAGGHAAPGGPRLPQPPRPVWNRWAAGR
ncbi:MAG: hypothetical protein ACRYFK_04005 [Janthinobacterium lividum]